MYIIPVHGTKKIQNYYTVTLISTHFINKRSSTDEWRIYKIYQCIDVGIHRLIIT